MVFAGIMGVVTTLFAQTPVPARPPAGGAGFAGSMLEGCATDLSVLSPVSGWPVRWGGEWDVVAVGTEAERQAALDRWSAADAVLMAEVEVLREGLAARRGAPAPVVLRVLEQIDGLLDAAEDYGAPFRSPARRAENVGFAHRWEAEVVAPFLKALRRYERFLREDYLPGTRTEPGIGALPKGRECYREAVRRWTTLEVDIDTLAAVGYGELERLRERLVRAADPSWGATAEEILDHLREWEGPHPFAGPADVISRAEAAVARAREAAPRAFATVGNTEVDVIAMPPYMESSFPAGIYRPTGSDGRPAYWVNTSRAVERRLLSEVIAFHETVPGHHLNFSAVQAAGIERGRPFNSGFAEGWALYSEGVADELGLYSTRYDRVGYLAKQFWATSRLVVEPGLHLRGWSRKDAIDFMHENTAMAPAEIEQEVDRYVALPGQSLSYILGAMELRRIRARAEEQLGKDFDLRHFHDMVLLPGIRGLGEVAADVDRWVEGGGGSALDTTGAEEHD